MAALARPAVVDALIIGGGPAGLSAALAYARTMATAVVFDSHSYRNAGITHMHTVPSRDHFAPHEFRTIARQQITDRYETVRFEDVDIVKAAKKELELGESKVEGFEVGDKDGKSWQGRKIILATGSRDVFPEIEGYAENWPSHIYQCLACDGYEQRGTPSGILDFPPSPMSSHAAGFALKFDPRVTVFTNGPLPSPLPEPIAQSHKIMRALGTKFDDRKITRLVNNGPSHHDGITLHFESGEPITLGFLVHRPPTVNRAPGLIEQLGLETVPAEQGGHVKVEGMFNETSVKGVFAAGDTMNGMKQVVLAMAEGMKAAMGAGMQSGAEVTAAAVKEYEKREGSAP